MNLHLGGFAVLHYDWKNPDLDKLRTIYEGHLVEITGLPTTLSGKTEVELLLDGSRMHVSSEHLIGITTPLDCIEPDWHRAPDPEESPDYQVGDQVQPSSEMIILLDTVRDVPVSFDKLTLFVVDAIHTPSVVVRTLANSEKHYLAATAMFRKRRTHHDL